MTKTHILSIALLLILITGCTGPTTTAEPELLEDSPAEFSITITDITMAAGEGLTVRGTTTLPEGHCVYTQLFADGTAVDWWLVGKCYPLEGSEWAFTIPLGAEGTPAELDADPAYLLAVWWPGAPAETRDAFEFDLAAPPAP